MLLYVSILSFVTRSIGCTVIEMLTAKPPFNDLETNAAIFAIATKPVSYVLPPSCSEHVSSFLTKCLTKYVKSVSYDL